MYRDCKQVYNVIRTINTKLLLVAVFSWHLGREFTELLEMLFLDLFYFEEDGKICDIIIKYVLFAQTCQSDIVQLQMEGSSLPHRHQSPPELFPTMSNVIQLKIKWYLASAREQRGRDS